MNPTQSEPVDLRWECPACERAVEQTPCPWCACGEVEIVWSDGVRTDAAAQVVGVLGVPLDVMGELA